ncbi:MAG TPA: anti-sigma factor [Acidimicrobiales bacterium]|nr:anti-sigma factor [Acidimicrobiales bacterium]
MSTNDPGDPRLDTVVRLLDDPALWTEVPPGLRDRVVEAALAGVDEDTANDLDTDADLDATHGAGAGASGAAPAPAPGDLPRRRAEGDAVPLHAARRRRGAARSGRRPALLATAAAVVVLGLGVAGGLSLLSDEAADPLAEVALAGTEEAPGAAATARLTNEPAGVSVVLDVSGLEPAPPGTFYEVWLVGDSGKVSAGTFHMRGEQDDIKLWWGVAPEGYDAVTITRQPVDGGTTAEGVVVLRGELPAG